MDDKTPEPTRPLCTYCMTHGSAEESNLGFRIPVVGGWAQIHLCVRHFDELRTQLEAANRQLRKPSLILVPGRPS